MDPVVGLEIGTSKVVALVGDMQEDHTIAVLGMGEAPSIGIRKGEVVDMEKAVTCIRRALADAERMSDVAVHEVVVAISGGHIRGNIYPGVTPVRGEGGTVDEDDLESVGELARSVQLGADRDMLHTINQLYALDDNAGVFNPIGMVGHKLSLSILGIHGSHTHIGTVERTVERAQVDVKDIVFGGLASALGVLTPDQKRNGVVVIDLGAGTTDYIAYGDGVICCAGSLGIGGDHVTNDLVHAFGLQQLRTEKLKREYGMAIVPDGDDTGDIRLAPDVGFQGRSIPARALYTVIHARMEETLLKVKRRLDEEYVLIRASAGVVFTGGGAYMRGIEELGRRVFGVPCRVGRLGGDARMGGSCAVTGPEYATCYGLVEYTLRMQLQEGTKETSFLGRVVGQLFGR
jgi:cell division protein FtsA